MLNQCVELNNRGGVCRTAVCIEEIDPIGSSGIACSWVCIDVVDQGSSIGQTWKGSLDVTYGDSTCISSTYNRLDIICYAADVTEANLLHDIAIKGVSNVDQGTGI